MMQLFNPEAASGVKAPSGFYWNFSLSHIATYSARIIGIYFLQVGISFLAMLYLFFSRRYWKFVAPLALFVIAFHLAVLPTTYGYDWRLLPNGYFLGLLSIIGLYDLLANKKVAGVLRYGAVAVVAVWLLTYAVAIKHRYIAPDNREVASRWIEENVLTEPNTRVGLNKVPNYAFPDIITREWQQASDTSFSHYPDQYDAEFVVPQVLVNGEPSGFYETSGPAEIEWMIAQSPDYIILARRPSELWHEYLQRSGEYTLVRHFPKYNALSLSKLAMLSFDVYVYKRFDS
jgi:hypothetical protein